MHPQAFIIQDKQTDLMSVIPGTSMLLHATCYMTGLAFIFMMCC